MKIPRELKREELSLVESMRRIRASSSFSHDEVEQVIKSLPTSLMRARAFLCRIGGEWRYEFGEPYSVGTSVILGTDQNPEVRILLCGLLRLRRHASAGDYNRYILRLGDEQKHLDCLAELDPVLRAKELSALRYEPRSLGRDTSGPDWAMDFSDGSTCLVEVKARIKALLSLFESLRSGSRPSPHPERMPVPPGLLADVSSKFPVRATTGNALQGVWIFSPVWFIQGELETVFNSLDPERVRFLVVGRAWREYEVLAQDDEDKQRLLLRYALMQNAPSST
jgi:hypothetical protein